MPQDSPDIDPVRSPACGRVTEIVTVENDPGVEGRYKRVSIFLSLWDDHTTRSPIAGRVDNIRYTTGKFGIAFFKKNLLKNENNLVWLSREKIRLAVRQIAGRIARRIICKCQVGDRTQPGQDIGRITFGSCVQLYLPEEFRLQVIVGQKVMAGKTILATLS